MVYGLWCVIVFVRKAFIFVHSTVPLQVDLVWVTNRGVHLPLHQAPSGFSHRCCDTISICYIVFFQSFPHYPLIGGGRLGVPRDHFFYPQKTILPPQFRTLNFHFWLTTLWSIHGSRGSLLVCIGQKMHSCFVTIVTSVSASLSPDEKLQHLCHSPCISINIWAMKT